MHADTMAREVSMKEIEDVLSTLEYPTDRSNAAKELDGTTLILADGKIALDEVVQQTGSDRYERVGDLRAAIHAALPRRAVGEPYQSEGDA